MSDTRSDETGTPEAAEPEVSVETAADEAPEAGDEGGAEDVIAALEAERDELRDRLMRSLAEAENIRKRAERDRKDAEAYGGTKLARDLLAVHDNLGRAVASVDDGAREAAAALIEGVELTQKELLSAFAKHRIEVVAPEVGEKFDPKMHQAMFEAPVPHARPGCVIQVMQDGFMIADRLLRPAMVGVAAAGSGSGLPPEGEAPAAGPESGDGDAPLA
ncbi:nucleotide exchange factor GrpE [Rhodovulum sp. DZ06]|uniref:nucleotide exchange factor GrpE n=1 Tax=Rhodovulum sp. DZ06 TaxID=3425126 RepID=UPI003D34AA8C